MTNISSKKKLLLITAIVILIIICIVIAWFVVLKNRAVKNTQTTDTTKMSSTTSTTTTSSTEGNLEPPQYKDKPTSEEEVEKFLPDSSQPLSRILPRFTEHYSIEYNSSEKIYQITLYAILNHEWQYEQYKKDLAQYKKEALGWIAQQGVNIYDLPLEYNPPEAKDM